MPTILEEFENRTRMIHSLRVGDAEPRLLGLYKWMLAQPPIKHIVDSLKSSVDIEALLKTGNEHTPPAASTPEEIAVVGILVIEDCANEELFQLAYKYGVHPPYQTSSIQASIDEFIQRFIGPAIDYIRDKLESSEDLATPIDHIRSKLAESFQFPINSRFPDTSNILQAISAQLNTDDPTFNWFNVANSCREALKKFSSELLNDFQVSLDSNTKSGDVKAILKSFVLQHYSTGRFSETLLDLIQSVWDHTQSILHRESTTKEEALRCFIWTCLLVLELGILVPRDQP